MSDDAALLWARAINPIKRYKPMCDELDRPAKVSPLDRLVAAQKELSDASVAAKGSSGIVAGRTSGDIVIAGIPYQRDSVKKIADDIYYILGEDE